MLGTQFICLSVTIQLGRNLSITVLDFPRFLHLLTASGLVCWTSQSFAPDARQSQQGIGIPGSTKPGSSRGADRPEPKQWGSSWQLPPPPKPSHRILPARFLFEGHGAVHGARSSYAVLFHFPSAVWVWDRVKISNGGTMLRGIPEQSTRLSVAGMLV